MTTVVSPDSRPGTPAEGYPENTQPTHSLPTAQREYLLLRDDPQAALLQGFSWGWMPCR